MKFVVTGAGGMLGEHMLHHLRAAGYRGDSVAAIDKQTFNNDDALTLALTNCDAVIHLAGINRASDDELEGGNIGIANRLVDALTAAGATPHVLYSNSLHESSDSPYGRGKHGAHLCIKKWASANGAKYTELILPHVFGEFGRPFYNSGVHTFCHQIANNQSLTVNANGYFSLLHAGDVAEKILKAVLEGNSGRIDMKGEHISAPKLAESLQDLYATYTSNVIPLFETRLSLQLFNTLRSFMYPEYYPAELTLHTDDRGSLFEAVKTSNGGQAFLSTTKPGVTRGNHFHFEKVERFLVVAGEAVIRIRRLGTEDIREFYVSGDQPCYVDMPTLHAHSITNIGNTQLLTMFWSHEIFNPDASDTYAETVIP